MACRGAWLRLPDGVHQVPGGPLGGTAAATTFLQVEALFVVTGLTSGTAYTWDAAYGVETLVAATGIKYGGPERHDREQRVRRVRVRDLQHRLVGEGRTDVAARSPAFPD
jgi:hypothetical protein